MSSGRPQEGCSMLEVCRRRKHGRWRSSISSLERPVSLWKLRELDNVDGRPSVRKGRRLWAKSTLNGKLLRMTSWAITYFAENNFWCKVLWCATECPRSTFDPLCKPKICNLQRKQSISQSIKQLSSSRLLLKPNFTESHPINKHAEKQFLVPQSLHSKWKILHMNIQVSRIF